MQVVVIFGGRSTEYSISCLSAASVLRNMRGHDIIKIGITKEGKWYKTAASEAMIEDGSWIGLDSNTEVNISFADRAFVWKDGMAVPDVVFPVLHGRNGEDGTIQGLFELMRVPYVGCGVLASAVCMDKAYANMIFEREGLKHVEWTSLVRHEFYGNEQKTAEYISARFGYPVFVKPSNAGSSIGISKCADSGELIAALKLAFSFDRRVLVEKAVENPLEIEVAVIGNEEPVASVTGRIRYVSAFYDFDAKYCDSASELCIPSGSDKEELIRSMAVRAYSACDCRGLARVDFMVDGNGEVYINEVNTMPGFTSGSMHAKLFAASGIDYGELIEKLLNYAIDDMRERDISV